MINSKLQSLLQYRIEQEEFSNRLYLSMHSWLEYNGFAGAAKLWHKYAEEETVHAKWAYSYLEDLNIKPKIPQLPAPDAEFDGIVDIIEKSLEHEKLITKQCNDLAIASLEVKCFMTLGFAQKFLKEQTEEMARNQYWLDRLEAFGDSDTALRLLDNEMGCKE